MVGTRKLLASAATGWLVAFAAFPLLRAPGLEGVARHLRYGMFLLVARETLPFFAEWLLWTLAGSLVFLCLGLALRAARVAVPDMLSAVCAGAACSFFALWAAWQVQQYWLTHPSHWRSIAACFVVFTLAGLAWKLLATAGPAKVAAPLSAFLVLLNAVALAVAAHGRLTPPPGPNTILIVVDTLRADHVGCYGYPGKTTPRIDAFREESVMFRNAVATAPWTQPSVGGILSSRSPGALGYRGGITRIGGDYLLLPELFRWHGYRTAGVISHTLLASQFGFRRGYEIYDDENARGHLHVSSASVSDKAIAFIRRNRSEKFFLFLHYFDPHNAYLMHREFPVGDPYDGPLADVLDMRALRERAPRMGPRDVAFLKDKYDSEIAYTDFHIGRLIDELKALGLYDDALIVFVSDHGEAFRERADMWIGHSKTLYQELIRVPLLVHLPSRAGGSAGTVDQYVSLLDVMPTVAAHAGLRVPSAYAPEGRKLDLTRGEQVKEAPVFSETLRMAALQSVVLGGWKLILDLDGGSKALYNIEEDPGELKDVAASHPGVYAKLGGRLAEWSRRMESERNRARAAGRHEPGLTERQKRNLRSLGYLD